MLLRQQGCLVNEAKCNGQFAKKLLLKDVAANCIVSESSYITKHKSIHNALSLDDGFYMNNVFKTYAHMQY